MKKLNIIALSIASISLVSCVGSSSSTTQGTSSSGNAATTASFAGYTPGSVSNWPNYIAMGTITNNGYFVAANSEHGLDNPTDAIFKYAGSNGAGDMGQIIFPQTTSRTIYEAQQYSAATNHLSRPVLVEYTLQLSGGDNGLVDLASGNMAYHFINIATDSALLEANGAENGYGSLVLNPDALGFIQQNYPNMKGTLAKSFPVMQQIKSAVCYLTTPVSYSFTWSNTGQTVNYAGTPTQIITSITSQAKGAWIMSDSYSDWTVKAATWYSKCSSNPTLPAGFALPTFTDDFAGWIQATNWIIKKFGPDVTYGWHENISMLPQGSLWVKSYNAYNNSTSSTIQTVVSDPTLNFLKTYKVFDGVYRPDFLVFDRYEIDDTQSAMYFYNDSDWKNIFTLVGQVSRGLNNIPVMLWQMPGGHIQVNGDMDPRGDHGGTFTNFIFGDSKVNLGASYATSNLKPIWSSFYSYLTSNGFKWNKDNGNMKLAADNNVFSILWGGGTGPTTGLNAMGTYDGGWLAAKVKTYYTSPQAVVIPSPQPTPIPTSTPSPTPSITPSPAPSSSPTPVPSISPTPAPAACSAATWNSLTAYTGGQQVSENNKIYVANWWSQGNEPASHSGVAGTGQPWTYVSDCSGPLPSPAPAPSPSVKPSPSPVPVPSPSVKPSPSPRPVPSPSPSVKPSPKPSPVPTTGICSSAGTWVSGTAYTGGAQVKYNGYLYKANWWTQNNNPASSNGGAGSGQPWTKVSNC